MLLILLAPFSKADAKERLERTFISSMLSTVPFTFAEESKNVIWALSEPLTFAFNVPATSIIEAKFPDARVISPDDNVAPLLILIKPSFTLTSLAILLLPLILIVGALDNNSSAQNSKKNDLLNTGSTTLAELGVEQDGNININGNAKRGSDFFLRGM